MTSRTSLHDSTPQFDHLILAVPDAASVKRTLAAEWGLHALTESRVFADGMANLVIPLEPPEYLEILYIHDATTFQEARDDDAKRRLLAGGGLLGWGLRTWDLDAVARELGVEPDAPTMMADGSAGPWRTLSKPGDPFGFPFYIQYSASAEERLARWNERLREVGHRRRPGRTAWVEVSGHHDELRQWLSPAAHLAIRVADGPPGIKAGIPVGSRELTLSSDWPGGIGTSG